MPPFRTRHSRTFCPLVGEFDERRRCQQVEEIACLHALLRSHYPNVCRADPIESCSNNLAEVRSQFAEQNVAGMENGLRAFYIPCFACPKQRQGPLADVLQPNVREVAAVGRRDLVSDQRRAGAKSHRRPLVAGSPFPHFRLRQHHMLRFNTLAEVVGHIIPAEQVHTKR